MSHAALFGYSNLLGSDQQFSAAEITGNRTLEFNDPAAELFSFDVIVTAFERALAGPAPVRGSSAGRVAEAQPEAVRPEGACCHSRRRCGLR